MFFKRNSSKHHLNSQSISEDQQSNYAASLDQGFGIEPDPDTHMANAELFSSVAQERDDQVSFSHTFYAKDHDDSSDLVGHLGLGSAQEEGESFSFINQGNAEPNLTIYEDQYGANQEQDAMDDEYGSSGAHGSSSAYGDSAFVYLPDDSRSSQEGFVPEYDAVATSTTSFAMVDDVDLYSGKASGVGDLSAQEEMESERIGHSGNMALADDDDYASEQIDIASVSHQYAEDASELESYEDEPVQPMDEHEAAAQLIAEMMLGRNPLAHLTNDAPETSLTSSSTQSSVDSDTADKEAQSLGREHEHGESTELESASASSDVALEIVEDDTKVVNKRIKEPKHKIELVEENDPPKETFLDAESEHQAALAEQREDAIVQAFVGGVERNPSGNGGPSFNLLRQQFIMVNAAEQEEPDLLSEEQEEYGNKADINDYITGNITTLRTGTDSVVVPVGKAAAADEGDTIQEQPGMNVGIVKDESLNISDENQIYTSTLSATRITYEQPKLLPTLFKDILRHFYVYALAILLGVLSLIKVYQVQDTRDMTARLNEVSFNNEELEKEWLNLLATRQNLSEHAKIRSFATRQLQMVSPKTENEQVISLH